MENCVQSQILFYRDTEAARCAHTKKSEFCDIFLRGFWTNALLSVRDPTRTWKRYSIEVQRAVLQSITLPPQLVFRLNGCDCWPKNSPNHSLCKKCGRPTPNHIPTCTNLNGFRAEVVLIYQLVEGLDYHQFVRKEKAGGELILHDGPDSSVNLWDSLKYV